MEKFDEFQKPICLFCVFTGEQTRDLYHAFAAGKLHWTRLWSIVVLGWYLQKENITNL